MVILGCFWVDTRVFLGGCYGVSQWLLGCCNGDTRVFLGSC